MPKYLFIKTVLLIGFSVFCLNQANVNFGQEFVKDDKIKNGETTSSAETVEPDNDVPPPFVKLSLAETSQLNAVTDYKQRTQLCLQLANSRLQRAETLTNDADFQDAVNELAGYQAVIENGLVYLRKDDNSGKVRDNLKRFELALRTHAPRIETIRRSSPFSFGKYVKAVLNFARDARSRALEAFFSDTVLRGEASGDSLQTASQKSSTTRSTNNSPKKP